MDMPTEPFKECHFTMREWDPIMRVESTCEGWQSVIDCICKLSSRILLFRNGRNIAVAPADPPPLSNLALDDAIAIRAFGSDCDNALESLSTILHSFDFAWKMTKPDDKAEAWVTASMCDGLHMRASMRVVDVVVDFNSLVALYCGDTVMNAKRITSVAMGAVVEGSRVLARAIGYDASECIMTLVRHFEYDV